MAPTEDGTPLSALFLAHIRDTDVQPGETVLAVVYTLLFSAVLTVVLGMAYAGWLS